MDLNLKYRPTRWSSVVGQEAAIVRLRAILNSDTVPATYMFAGPSGTGKTTLAKLFSDYLNCYKGSKCNKCAWCKSSKSDIVESNAANARGIDDIRSLIDSAKFKPRVGRYKIYIMNEVQQLTPAAESALLDFCENVPEHVILMFTTMEPNNVNKAFRHRTCFFNMEVPTDKDIQNRLLKICLGEGIDFPKTILSACAKASVGCVRHAVQLLDSCIQYSAKTSITDEEKFEQLVLKNIINVIQDSEEELAVSVLTALLRGDIKEVHRNIINVKQHVSFLMKLNYITMYILDIHYVGKHPSVWPTAANLKMLEQFRVLKKEGLDSDVMLDRAYIILGAVNSIKPKLNSFMVDARAVIMSEFYSILSD